MVKNSSINKEILQKVEIDTIRISDFCPRNCVHCSQDSKLGFLPISVDKFNSYIDNLIKLQKEYNENLLAKFILTTTDSDPLLHPQLPEILESFYKKTGRKFYLLTSGWYDHKTYQKNAEWISKNMQYIERLTLTFTSFPRNPNSLFDHINILVNVIKTFKDCPKDKFFISPQFADNVEPTNIYSEKFTNDMLKYVLELSGCNYDDFENRINPRAITGLGRAKSVLNISKSNDYLIYPEDLEISTREKQRIYSGMIDMYGSLSILEGKRVLLNRDYSEYKHLVSLA